MGKRGPPPKPTSLRQLEGDKSHRPQRPEAKPRSGARVPAPPAWLSPAGKRVWRRSAPGLHRLGLLTDSDVNAFAAYCREWATYLEASAAVAREGMVLRDIGSMGQAKAIAHPCVAVGNQALANAIRIGARFGLTPSDRVALPGTKDEKRSPIEELGKRGQVLPGPGSAAS